MRRRLLNKIDDTAFIDLGLPSGTLWATCNLGASEPEQSGLYFKFGNLIGSDKDSEGIKDFENQTYYTGYDNLPIEYDAAYKYSNGVCKVPSIEDWKELIQYTVSPYNNTTGWDSSKMGIIRKSIKNDNYIFLPAAGYLGGGIANVVNLYGLYWSSSLWDSDKNYVADFRFTNDLFQWTYGGRADGRTIRPIKKK